MYKTYGPRDIIFLVIPRIEANMFAVNDCRPASNLDFPHLKYSIKIIQTNKGKQLPLGEGTPRQSPKGS
jgi:hypothetical protein